MTSEDDTLQRPLKVQQTTLEEHLFCRPKGMKPKLKPRAVFPNLKKGHKDV